MLLNKKEDFMKYRKKPVWLVGAKARTLSDLDAIRWSPCLNKESAMGIVKRSGKTFEERRNAAIIRNKEERDQQARIKMEREISLTPEEKESRVIAEIAVTSFFALINDMLNPHRHEDLGWPNGQGWLWVMQHTLYEVMGLVESLFQIG
jgi:hypothetical protein